MSALREPRFTETEYLALESASQTKHEFYGGQIIAMSGASPTHDDIVGNTFASLHAQLRGGRCRVYTSDVRVKVAGPRSYFYPDIKVVCGAPDFNSDNPPCLLNPTLIIEVLSPSTADFDRGAKASAYRQLESLQELLLISQDSPRVERFVRQPDGQWLLGEIHGLDAVLELRTIGCTLALAEVYARVEFTDEA
ncbi:MAG: Uma2 family endonuclease [Anaerolineae bacterium]|nr:Uma2 family endonuclease [Anaerolineae bacterium]